MSIAEFMLGPNNDEHATEYRSDRWFSRNRVFLVMHTDRMVSVAQLP